MKKIQEQQELVQPFQLWQLAVKLATPGEGSNEMLWMISFYNLGRLGRYLVSSLMIWIQNANGECRSQLTWTIPRAELQTFPIRKGPNLKGNPWGCMVHGAFYVIKKTQKKRAVLSLLPGIIISSESPWGCMVHGALHKAPWDKRKAKRKEKKRPVLSRTVPRGAKNNNTCQVQW